MKKINLKENVDKKGISIEELSRTTNIEISALEEMYNKGTFNGDNLGVNALTSLMQALDIINVNDLIPTIK